MMLIVIVYDCEDEPIKRAAESVREGVLREKVSVVLIATDEAEANFELFHKATTLVFGTRSSLGTLATTFKKFIEATAQFRQKQKWKNKFAAGFTHSSTLTDDRTNTLQRLSLFAAQHSMLWISAGMLPKYEIGPQLEQATTLDSCLGLMTPTDQATDSLYGPKEMAIAEWFGQRIAQVTRHYQWQDGRAMTRI